MNVLHIIESLNIGGAERRLLNDLKFLNKDKIKNIVCCLSNGGRLKDELINMDIPLYNLGLSHSLDIKGIAELVRLIRRHHIDIIHTQLFYADLYGRLAGRLMGRVKIVSTIQSSVYEQKSMFLYSSKRRLIDSWSGRLCNNAFIAVSDFVKRSAVKRLGYDERKIEVIYNSVDTGRFEKVDTNEAELLRRELGIDNSKLVLIAVGKLNPPKGQKYLLMALPKMIERLKNLILIIAGDGPCRKGLEELSRKLHIDKHIIFLGESQKVRELLYLSNIFVFPTLSEGFPLTLLEAMAMKRPCIASDIEPIREILKDGETGFLTRPSDADSIASTILKVADSYDSALEIAQNGYELINERFNAKRGAEQLGRFYERVSNSAGFKEL